MNNKLLASLQCSSLLAERALLVTPDMPLSWNPRQADSTLAAVNQWLTHVNNTLFWVSAPCHTLSEAEENLAYIHLQPEGFNFFYEESFQNHYPGTLARLLMAFLELEHVIIWDDVEASVLNSDNNAYQEISEQWGFEEIVPLHQIFLWIETHLGVGQVKPGPNATLVQVFNFAEIEPRRDETWEIWQGFANLLRWLTNDTGYDILDYPADEDGDEYVYELGLEWLDPDVIADLHNNWLHVKRFIDQRETFDSWLENNPNNLKRVVMVMKTACRQVVSSGWENPHWDEMIRKCETIRSGWYDDELIKEEE